VLFNSTGVIALLEHLDYHVTSGLTHQDYYPLHNAMGTGHCGGGRYGGALQNRVDATAESHDTHIKTLLWTLRRNGRAEHVSLLP
jgi:hypothetical protein